MSAVASGTPDFSHLSGRDRAFALRLLRESTIWRARLDRALARYCNRKLESLDPDLLAALRVGAVQLLILGTPPHAAVSETVSALGKSRGRGLVNAVLRKLSGNGEPDIRGMSLAQRFSHPEDLVSRWVERYGAENTESLLEWNNSVPYLGGTPSGETGPCTGGRYLKGYTRVARAGEELARALTDGIYIQDEAAAVVGSSCAGLAVGGRVLELCAAPGGKTHHLQRSARLVVSMDVSLERMKLLIENRERLGWKSVVPLVGDGMKPPLRCSFDLVVLDAPCTNTGVYRRRSDARWNWSQDLLDRMTGIQRELLESAWELASPGGFLAYSTCSLEYEENQFQVQLFEKEHSEAERIDLPAPPELVRNGMISIFPPEHHIDGHFAAAWRKIR